MKNRNIWTIVRTILLICVAGIIAFPFLHMLAVSLSDDTFVLKEEVYFWPKGIQLQAYAQVLADPEFLLLYKNSIQYATVGTVISLAVLVTGAYALSKKRCPFRGLLQTLIIFALIFSGGMIPTYVILKRLALLNTMWALILPQAFSVYYFLVLRSFFKSVSQDMEDAARMDGLSDAGVLFHIVLPNMRGIIAVIGLLCFTGYWNSFVEPALYLTDMTKYPVQMYLRRCIVLGILPDASTSQLVRDFRLAEMSVKCAEYILGVLPLLILYPFVQKHFVQAVVPASVKVKKNPADIT